VGRAAGETAGGRRGSPHPYYAKHVTLSKSSRRAYYEVYYKRAHGESSPEWKQRPGSQVELEIWMDAFDIAAEENVSPWDALLQSVRRRAARVIVIDRIIQAAWDQHRGLCEQAEEGSRLDPNVPPEEVCIWMGESRNEERLLTRASKMAIDAGVAKMLIERDQLEGRLLADALVAGLDALDLTTEQRMTALGEAQKTLTAIAGIDEVVGPSAIPGVQTDDNDDKKED
jgi:hypothetical protein